MPPPVVDTLWRQRRLIGRVVTASSLTPFFPGFVSYGRRACVSARAPVWTPSAASLNSVLENNSQNSTRGPIPLPPDLLLSDVRVVLVAPKHEANIGAVARVCANFECLNLYVVEPRCSAIGSEARKVACGDAVLDRILVVDSLATALADTAGSIGFTRRAGATRLTHASLGHLLAEFPWALPLQPVRPVATSDESRSQREPERISVETGPSATGEEPGTGEDTESENGRSEGSKGADSGPYVTALVFGREESGLTEAELRLCSHACAIPTGRVQPSMNLSHAVAAVLGELFSRRCGLLEVASSVDVDTATAATATCIGPQLLRLPLRGQHIASGHPDGNSNGTVECGDGRSNNTRDLTGDAGTSGRAANGCAVADGAVGAPQMRQRAAEDGGGVDKALLPASAQELDLLIRKVAAVAEEVGMSGEEGHGGGNAGNHGRRRLPVGHLRAVVSRARVTAAESRSLHGLVSAVLQHLNPEHPLEAAKRQRKRRGTPDQRSDTGC